MVQSMEWNFRWVLTLSPETTKASFLQKKERVLHLKTKEKRSPSVPSLDTHCHIEMKHFFGNATPERSMAFLSSFRVNAKHGKVRKSPWNHWKSRDGQRSFQCFRSLLFMVRKLFLLLCFFILDVHFQTFSSHISMNSPLV